MMLTVCFRRNFLDMGRSSTLCGRKMLQNDGAGPSSFSSSSSFLPSIRKAVRVFSAKSTSRSSRIPARDLSSDKSESDEHDQTSANHRRRQRDQLEKRLRLDVAIVGAPNSGKSQLLNVLTDSTVAAVSRKRHTTRRGIMAVRTLLDRKNPTQVVFKDTPGFLKLENAKEERLDRDLIVTASTEIQDVDYTLLVVDAARTLSHNYKHALVSLMLYALRAQGRTEEVEVAEEQDNSMEEGPKIIDEKKDEIKGDQQDHDDPQEQEQHSIDSKSKFAIVLNKIDLVKPKSKLLDIAMEVGALADECILRTFTQRDGQENHSQLQADEQAETLELLQTVGPSFFYISALEKDGTDELLQHLAELATPCKDWPLSDNEVTDMSIQERIQEIIREKIYRCTHRELPHSVQQQNRLFRRLPQRGIIIHQDLIVYTKSHQRLLYGSSGGVSGKKTLQRIEDSSRKDLQELFGCDVALQLKVKLINSKQQRGSRGGAHALKEQRFSSQDEFGTVTEIFNGSNR